MKRTILLLFFFVLTNSAFAQVASSEDGSKSKFELPGVIVMDFGFNLFNQAPDDLSINWFKSKSFGLYYMKSYSLGNKFSFNPSVGINFEKYGFTNDNSLGYLENSDELSIIELSQYDEIKKNQLAVNYLDLPLQLRYYPKGKKSGRGMYFAAGPIVSLLMESHTKVKFTEDGRDQTLKHRDDYQHNRVRYGAQARFGFGSVGFFYKRYLSGFFNGNGPANTSNMMAHSIGISISGL